MSPTGSARISKIPSASEGITFGPTHGLRMFVTTEVRNIEYLRGWFFANQCCASSQSLPLSDASYASAFPAELIAANVSRDVRVVSFNRR